MQVYSIALNCVQCCCSAILTVLRCQRFVLCDLLHRVHSVTKLFCLLCYQIVSGSAA
uniref:Uncharacterized protein n=1 Tax=Anguilla anguilla TaxID=7936 RepID=A0A0E9TJD0_ANGAN